MESDERRPRLKGIVGDGVEEEPSADHAQLIDSDVRILAYLATTEKDYGARIAGNTGLHVAYVETRLDSLRGVGLVEPAAVASVYRITASGRDALARAHTSS